MNTQPEIDYQWKQRGLAIEILSGLLYTTSRDMSLPQGRLHNAAIDILPAVLNMNVDELEVYIEEMYEKHGMSLRLDNNSVRQIKTGWEIRDDVDGEAVRLTTEQIRQLAEHAGVIS